MSHYDYRPNEPHGSRSLDYGNDTSGTGLWAFVAVIALLALIGLLAFGGSSGAPPTDGEALPTAAPTPAEPTAGAATD